PPSAYTTLFRSSTKAYCVTGHVFNRPHEPITKSVVETPTAFREQAGFGQFFNRKSTLLQVGQQITPPFRCISHAEVVRVFPREPFIRQEISPLSAGWRVDRLLVKFISNLMCLEHALASGNRCPIRSLPFFILQTHVRTCRKNLYGLSKRSVFNLHQELDGIA